MTTAATSDRTDVVDVLTADHQEFLGLLARIRASESPEDQKELADVLVAELVRHSVAEETWVYPAMREHLPDGDAKVAHDTEEHEELEVLLRQLEAADPADVEFVTTVARIEEVLRDHVADEESEQFPELRRHVPAEDLRTMARRVEKTKEVAPTRPHPGAPNTRLFHTTVGLGAGMVDRLRDALAHRTTEPDELRGER
ncbi:hemerythrin domain-containing protein [Aquipuribacter nitratireducens]|uniref:Hemerythrin domain-containing protein n=1 Tax=Aquipuribacter nitratireducens TaxID=650104 RepID=A0ABW0GRN2_9MICO